MIECIDRVHSERFVIYGFEDRITITGEEADDIIIVRNYDELAELRDLIDHILPEDFPSTPQDEEEGSQALEAAAAHRRSRNPLEAFDAFDQ